MDVQTTDVRVPVAATPVWPNRCVGCNAEQPNAWTHVRVKTELARLTLKLSILRGALVGRRLAVPTCAACGPALRRGRRLDGALGVVAGVVAIAIGKLWHDNDALTIGLFIALWVPWLGYRVAFRPVAFDTTLVGSDLLYEFRSREYAEAFAEANGASTE